MKRLTARWVRKAEADLVGARTLAVSDEPLFDLICFHCQQAAEKYLKALLQDLDVEVPRTHKLGDLLLLLHAHDAKVKTLGRSLAALNRYAVDVRYPGEDASKRQAAAALRHAEKVRGVLREHLGLPP